MRFRIGENELLGHFLPEGRLYTLEYKRHWWSKWKIIMVSPWINEIIDVREGYKLI